MARVQRPARAAQRGATLIELLITIAILAVGFVAFLAAFAQTEGQVGSTADDAQLVSRARQISDLIQSEGFAYIVCASSGSGYQTALRNASVMTSRDTVVSVQQAQGTSTLTGPAGTVPLTPISACSGSGSDYGVQRITFRTASATGRTLTRVVYKRWN